MKPTPEHEKLKAVAHLSQAIYDFIEWCGEQGWYFAAYYNDTRMAPVSEGRERMLARYFDIDLNVLDNEKLQMLQECRDAQATG